MRLHALFGELSDVNKFVSCFSVRTWTSTRLEDGIVIPFSTQTLSLPHGAITTGAYGSLADLQKFVHVQRGKSRALRTIMCNSVTYLKSIKHANIYWDVRCLLDATGLGRTCNSIAHSTKKILDQ